MKLALAQYPVTAHASLEDWKAHVRRWVAEAAAQRAQVLVFPEYGAMELVSFLPADVQRSLPRQIQEMQKELHAFREHYRALAMEFKCAILAPSLPVIDPAYPKPVNRAYFFFPDGRFDFQDKTHMTRFEDETWGVGPGSPEHKVFEVFGAKFGVNICFDVEFPFAALALAKKGVQVLLAPSCTETMKGMNRVHVGARARALENQFYVAVAQTVGAASWSEAVDINTGTAVCFSTCDMGFPDDGVLAIGRLNESAWIYADVDLALIDEVRTRGQVFNYKNMQRY